MNPDPSDHSSWYAFPMRTWWKALVCCWLVGCSGDDPAGSSKPNSVTLSGTTACARYASLAAALGCAPPSSCMIDARCEAQSIAWMDCTAKDTQQCICESDGDLNCEGSFKSNEGPAACKTEYQAFEDCNGG